MGFIKTVATLLLLYIAYRVVRVVFAMSSKPVEPIINRNKSSCEDLVKDPVCGKYVPINSAISYERNNEQHYFCSQECLTEFKKQQ